MPAAAVFYSVVHKSNRSRVLEGTKKEIKLPRVLPDISCAAAAGADRLSVDQIPVDEGKNGKRDDVPAAAPDGSYLISFPLNFLLAFSSFILCIYAFIPYSLHCAVGRAASLSTLYVHFFLFLPICLRS